MAYSSIAKPTDYFNTVLYTGNGGSSLAVTGVGFQPDWVWVKSRSDTEQHALWDSVRGGSKRLISDSTGAEYDNSTQGIQSFDSDGFTAGDSDQYNKSSQNVASWNWLAANGTASNSDGGTSSTVSVNQTSGFSIVGWTGTGSATTVGHGLGVAPKMIILKNRSEVYGWQVYHESLGNTKYLELSKTDAEATSSQSWNDTSPTSSVFSVGASDSNNKSGNNIIAYCFAEKKGYSKFGSYTGNGNADGTFVYTGFKPAFVLMKKTSGGQARNWCILDNKREGFNPENDQLHPNTNGVESMGSGTTLDLLSNGFKLRVTDDDKNGSGDPYIYMAFAENPFVGNDSGTAVPVTAR
jgi:hypothetical protein